MRIPVEISKAWRLFNHGPVTLLSAAHGGQENLMPAAWVTPLDFDPPKLTVVLAGDAFTRGLVERAKELVVQVPPRSMLDVVEATGACSGADTDKWSRFNVGRARVAETTVPLVEGCVAWMALRVLDEPALASRYDLFVCEGFAAWADDRVYTATARLREDIPPELRSLHHIAGGVYLVDGETVHARAPASPT